MVEQISKCIYCLQTSEAVRFNREHVLPEGFGRFRGALTLHRTVCQPCNTFFGETLDKDLSRKAVEGLERYRWGVKKPEEISKFSFENIRLRALEGGDFKGAEAHLYHDVEEGKILARPNPFVAIHNDEGEEFTHFTPEQILDGSWRMHGQRTDWRRGIKVFGPCPASVEM